MVKISEKPTKIIGDIKYYNTPSIAKILKVDPYTIREYFRKNYFKGIKIGRNWYISKNDLEFFIINGKLKTRDNMNYADYKIVEESFLAKIKANLKEVEKQIEKYRKVRTAYETANLMRRYEGLKQTLENYKNNKMTEENFNTFI
ncbi:hypothetical protein ES705_39729 [subsurface metagenome]